MESNPIGQVYRLFTSQASTLHFRNRRMFLKAGHSSIFGQSHLTFRKVRVVMIGAGGGGATADPTIPVMKTGGGGGGYIDIIFDVKAGRTVLKDITVGQGGISPATQGPWLKWGFFICCSQ